MNDLRGEDANKELEILITEKLRQRGTWHKSVYELEDLTGKKWAELEPIIKAMRKRGKVEFQEDTHLIILLDREKGGKKSIRDSYTRRGGREK